jgi:hypothetical protein
MRVGVLHAAKAKSSALAMNHASIAGDVHSIVSFQKGAAKFLYPKGSRNSLFSHRVQATAETYYRYLRDLQKQVQDWQRAASVKRPREDLSRFDDYLDAGNTVDDFGAPAGLLGPRPEESPTSPVTELSCNIWTSPFTLPTPVINNTHQEQRKWSQ